MAKSWELSDEQKKAHDEQSREIAAEWDQETGKKKGEGESTGESEDVDSMDSADMNRERGERTERVPDSDAGNVR